MNATDENVFNFGDDLIFNVGRTGELLQANPPGLSALGLSEAGMNGRNLCEWILVTSREDWDTCLEAACAGVAINGANLTLQTSADPELMVEASLHPNASKIVVCLRCLNDQQKVRQALRESEARFRTVLTAIPDLLIVFDLDGRYRQIYTSDADSLLLPAESLEGKCLHDVVSQEEAERGLQRIREVIETQQPRFFEHMLEIRGRLKWYSVKVVPFGSSHDPCVLWVSRDVTAMIEARQQRERDALLLRDLLELEQKARDVVAYEIHDGFVQYAIGTQMWLESGMEMLPEDLPTGESIRDAFDTARDSIERAIADARAMIRDLRPVSMEDHELADGLQQLVDLMQKRSTAPIQFACYHAFPKLLPLLETQIFRIVQESLMNVIRHSQATAVSVTVAVDGESLLLTVVDNGCGFDPGKIPAGHYGIEGILRRCEVFGGTGEIQSAPGEGTKITIRMPVLQPEEQST